MCDYPIFANPRMAAGGPLANDVIKCQLKPLDRGAYGVSFTEAAFPAGVCDFSKPGADRAAPMTWPTFAGAREARRSASPALHALTALSARSRRARASRRRP
jgi:hypothetical protein